MTDTTKRTRTEADRQTARYTMWTTGRAAEELNALGVGGTERIDADTVRGWIVAWIEGDHEGGLQGGDFRRAGASRPQYMTTPEYVDAFVRRRFGAEEAA